MTDPNPPSEHEEQQQERWYERTPYQVLLFAGGIAFFGLVGGWLLDWYIDPKTSGQKKDLVQALGLITAGVAGAGGIYFTWRGQRLTQRGQDENQRNTQEQLRLTREGQITERFTKAIDQLGNEERTEIRLGGIYALERIAKESEEDHWPIMEILTYYVRGLGPHTAAQVHPVAQAIMTVIKRRSRHYGHGESEPLDLQATSLQGTNLREAHLEKVNLRGANLQGANLEGAHLMSGPSGSLPRRGATYESGPPVGESSGSEPRGSTSRGSALPGSPTTRSEPPESGPWGSASTRR